MSCDTMKPESKCVWIPGPVIIGAGPSGLAAAACLKERGVPSLILEKEGCIGSLWRLKTHDSLQLHLPKEFCQLPYVPFPSEFPTYASKQQFISYLEDYADHFGIKPMFGQEVQWAMYEETTGFWQVQTSETRYVCRWLIIASGENAEPVTPDIDGLSNYRGELMHSSTYKDGTQFKGNKILVVGCGNSGMEVSLDLCNNGAQVSLVVRDKLHILPREVFGKSTFALSVWLMKWFHVKLIDRIILLCARLILGDTNEVGIKRPEMGPLELKNYKGKTPVLDVGAFARIKSGEIKVVDGIQRFTTNYVEFLDGRVEEFDLVVIATGYKSNVSSWLKEGDFFNREDGFPKKPFPNNWKGNNGIYSVGFTKRGLLGTSIDAQRVAEDISRQWNSETKHLHLKL
ncbi:probable indole-3-pyruvate monooxygenase YUCCA3 [Tripterygium wilfordii]|nr:probable indole-3-pyruvate monooxygenase YUCCA3 [Tripterygium wilfordii]